MAAEGLAEFTTKLQSALRCGKTACASELLTDNRNYDYIKNGSWELIPVLARHLTGEERWTRNDVYRCSVSLISLISENSNPEEALLQFISEIEEARDDVQFTSLLDPLYKLLIRIPTKKVNSVAWSLNAIHIYLGKCDIPNYENLEGKEKLLVDNTDEITRLDFLYDKVLIFYGNIISDSFSASADIKNVLCKFLVQLLGSPLCYLHMVEFGGTKPKGRNIAEEVTRKLFRVISDPFLLIETRFQNDELVKPNTLSLANLFYLIFSEGIYFEKIPKVYDSVFLFTSRIYLFNSLLTQENAILVEKGILLTEATLSQATGHKFSYLLLDSIDHCMFCQALSKIILYHPTDAHRRKAFKLFREYLVLFETRGMYLIIFNLTRIITHSGLIGYVITFYKDLMNEEFQSETKNMSVYFQGPKLFKMLRTFCNLQDKEETNLMDNVDRIISALNFLRFLAIKDKKNQTLIWNFFPTLEEIYLEPLRLAIELSRAHYELKIKEIKQETNIEGKNDNKAEVTITVQGKSLSKMDKEEQINILNSSLTVFDVMQSLLSRVTECIGNGLP